VTPSFPDAELEDLKERLKATSFSVGPKIVKAIIARLEAAEKALHLAPKCEHFGNEDFLEACRTWRKEAGK
jgi:hypothetical protein